MTRVGVGSEPIMSNWEATKGDGGIFFLDGIIKAAEDISISSNLRSVVAWIKIYPYFVAGLFCLTKDFIA